MMRITLEWVSKGSPPVTVERFEVRSRGQVEEQNLYTYEVNSIEGVRGRIEHCPADGPWVVMRKVADMLLQGRQA